MQAATPDKASRAFSLLDEKIQHWIWRHEWTEFRDVQEKSIPLLLEHSNDVILTAATSSGKTEAAFLPILSTMLRSGGGLSVYISPLTALINDQFLRMSELCERLEIPVHPWHGGITASIKKRFLTNPGGVLLITPESLQAMFCNHGFEIRKLFDNTLYIVIDELHSFIGSERGKQLQTLLHFLDIRTKKKIVRVGLSATLGNMELAAEFLSGSDEPKRKCNIVVSNDKKAKTKILLKGITEDKTVKFERKEEESRVEHDDDIGDNDDDFSDIDDIDDIDDADNSTFSAPNAIADYLYAKLRGSNNLIFPNTRSKVEFYTHLLSTLCSANGAPNEFYAHHGNLAKEIREDAEKALKSTEHSATVICTNTLELGIDVGDVASVVQIESPPSVASLRQRLGRSGRRQNDPSVLRAFTIEEKLHGSNHIFAQLRESTFQLSASIMLLLEGWCEPPRPHGMHLSTLLQQILAIITERGGVEPETAYNALCETGPFTAVDRNDFDTLVETLIFREIIEQDETGILLLAEKGEKMTSHYSFYASFSSEVEYRIVSGDKTLGTLPVSSSLQIGDFIIFAGKTWRIQQVHDKSRCIEVTFFGSGRPPIFTGSGFSIHTMIRSRMRLLYESSELVPFADSNANELIEQGRLAYQCYELFEPKNNILEQGRNAILFTWLGDMANRTLQLLFKSYGVNAYTGGIGLTIPGKSADEIRGVLDDLKNNPMPPPDKLLAESQNLFVEKWDKFLPKDLLIKNYASLYLARHETQEWLEAL